LEPPFHRCVEAHEPRDHGGYHQKDDFNIAIDQYCSDRSKRCYRHRYKTGDSCCG
jgi:hypothetical protein